MGTDRRPVRAAVLRRTVGTFSFEDIVLPPLGEREILVKISATGMCHTDLLPRHGTAPLPLVVGHEGSGVVAEVGVSVPGVRPGDHVVLTFDSCGGCGSCRVSMPAYCYDFGPRNTSGHGPDGAASATDAEGTAVHHRWFGQSSFATYAISTDRNTVVVDPDLPIDLLGPLGCGIQTGAGAVLNVLEPAADDRLAIFGGGAVGLSALLAAVAVGCEVVVVEPNQHRRDLALELGAHQVLAPTAEVVALIRDEFGLVDCSLDTTGNAQAVQAATQVLRPLGSCGVVAWKDDQPSIRLSDLILEGRRVIGICEGSSNPAAFIPRLIDMWRSGRFPFDRLITKFEFGSIDAAEAATRDGSAIKPLIVM